MSVTREIKEYLHSDSFRNELVRRYRRFEILAEAGLRTAVAHLLIEKVRLLADPTMGYCVTCEPRLKDVDVNVVPDVLIWKGDHPRIWIELKDTGRFNRKKAEKDWQKLQDYCKRYRSVKAGYFIYVARRDVRDFPIKRTRETLRYWPILITLQPHIADFEQWNEEFKKRERYKHPSD